MTSGELGSFEELLFAFIGTLPEQWQDLQWTVSGMVHVVHVLAITCSDGSFMAGTMPNLYSLGKNSNEHDEVEEVFSRR